MALIICGVIKCKKMIEPQNKALNEEIIKLRKDLEKLKKQVQANTDRPPVYYSEDRCI